MTSRKIIKESFYNWSLSNSQVSLVFQILTPLSYHLPVPAIHKKAGLENQPTSKFQCFIKPQPSQNMPGLLPPMF